MTPTLRNLCGLAAVVFLTACIVVPVPIPGGATVQPGPAAQTATPSGPVSAGIGTDVVALVNAERQAKGLTPLVAHSALMAAATAHASDMASGGFMSHDGSNGSRFSDRIRAQGYCYSRAAENVAAGQPTAQIVMQSWMTSSAHRDNILNPAMREIGVAKVGDKWAMELAAPC